jgi:CRISPR-associated protein Csm4
MQTKITYLKPKATFRAELRSDTLWGHLCWAVRNVYGQQELEKFIHDESFVISSTFPYLEIGEKKIEFFPKPLRYEPPQAINPDLSFEAKLKEMTKLKKVKKASNWLSKFQFEQFINGQDVQEENRELPRQKSVAITRNRIDRVKGGTLKVGEAGQLFHIEENYFEQENTGLFFLAKGNDFNLLEGGLRYLNHIGFGGDRGTGKGSFEVSEPQNFDLKEPQQANFQTNLSLYNPTEEESQFFENQESSSYQLDDRQGRLGFLNYANVRKNAFLFFKEGAYLPCSERNTFGKLLEVTTQITLPHKVYQYGKGFMIKIKTDN